MLRRIAPFTLGLLLVSPVVSAEPPEATTEAELEPSPSGSESGFRLALGLGLTGGVGIGPRCRDCSGGLGALAFGLELGYQVDRSWGVFLRSELGTALLSNYAGSYVMVEHTPIRQLSFAAGGGLEGVANPFFGSSYGGVAFPLRVSWNFLSEDAWEARNGNDAWRLSLTGVGGVATEWVDGFVRGALSIEYVWM